MATVLDSTVLCTLEIWICLLTHSFVYATRFSPLGGAPLGDVPGAREAAVAKAGQIQNKTKQSLSSQRGPSRRAHTLEEVRSKCIQSLCLYSFRPGQLSKPRISKTWWHMALIWFLNSSYKGPSVDYRSKGNVDISTGKKQLILVMTTTSCTLVTC